MADTTLVRALRDYWGVTGPDRSGSVMRRAVVQATDLSELQEALDSLPAATMGATGSRVAACRSALERKIQTLGG